MLNPKHADSTYVSDPVKAAADKDQRGAAQDSEELHYEKSHSKTSAIQSNGSIKKKPVSPQFEEVTLFNRLLLANNLQVHSSITGDGNCLFRAVEAQLKKLGIFTSHTYESLRKVAVEELGGRQ